jgi:hypothetical protein
VKSLHSPRSLVALAAVSLGVLSACGVSPPPAQELALEAIDSARDAQGIDLEESVKACMRDAVNNFTLTESQLAIFSDLDEASEAAADLQHSRNQDGEAIMARFEANLRRCR